MFIIMELKQSDRKLLAYLYHNYREPLTKIAKATGLSREQVDYKLNKYIKEGLIKKFFTIFNYSKFGYKAIAIILIKLAKPRYINEFYKALEKDKFWISKGFVNNKYDLFIQGVFKNEEEINKYVFNLIEKNNEIISDYLVIKPYFVELYPLKFLGKTGGSFVMLEKYEKGINLDEKDKK